MELFVPEKLINSRLNIQEKHAARNAFEIAPDEEMEELIKRLYESDALMCRATALAMTDKESQMLACYLPYNFYEIDETKLFDIMRHRMNKKTSRALFSNWQEAFNNRACNDFLKEMALDSTEFMQLLEDNDIESPVFIRVLDSPNIPLGYDEELVGRHFADGLDFDAKLKKHGVIEQSFLDIECKRALLTFCGRADYLICSESNILDIIKTYDAYMLKKFLFNFLDKLSLAQLQDYPQVAAYYRKTLGSRKTEIFREFFADRTEEELQKYSDWINIYKINLYFNNDERSEFWKQYKILNVVRYPVSDTVVMEFDDYVAVEFLGEEAGPIYICDKETFKTQFYDQLGKMNNNDIRIHFKIHKDLCTDYRNHTGRWQSHIAGVISKKQISQKMRIK